MYFNKAMIVAGQFNSFLKELMDQSYDDGEYYNDIHIIPADCNAFTIEWIQLPWSHDYGGSFEYVDDDQVVLREYEMPDGTYQYFETEDDKLEAVKDFLDLHPTYKQDQYGRWYDEAEVMALKEELDLENK